MEWVSTLEQLGMFSLFGYISLLCQILREAWESTTGSKQLIVGPSSNPGIISGKICSMLPQACFSVSSRFREQMWLP